MSIVHFDNLYWLGGAGEVDTAYLGPYSYFRGTTAAGLDGVYLYATYNGINYPALELDVPPCAEYWWGEEAQSAISAGQDLLYCMDAAGNALASLKVAADRSLYVVSMHATGTKLIQTPANAYPAGAWAILALRVKPGDGTGEAELWANGYQIGSISNAIIKGAGGQTGPIARLRWQGAIAGQGSGSSIGNPWAVAVDGVGRQTRIARPRAAGLTPSADTATADFAKSSGVIGWQLVDEQPPSSSDYLIGTAGQKSKFGVTAAWDLTGRNVVAVLAAAASSIVGAGGVSQKGSLTSNGVEVTSDAQTMTGALQHARVIRETDPDGDIPWTPTTAAAVQIGVEAV